jgi:hypothetical protein
MLTMKNKIKIFVEDGIVQGVFATDAEVEVIYGDTDAEDYDEYQQAWKRQSQDKALRQVYSD